MRLKILLSAYACEPFKGSEPEVGWQWALQMARFHDVTVLTRCNNQENIERGLAALPPETPHPRFIYFDEPPWMLKIKARLRIPQLYYIIWQKSAHHIIAELNRRMHFDLIHHVTFAGYRYTTAIWGHEVPCIWGPIGGMESIPSHLMPWRHASPLFFELLRNANNLIQSMPFHVIPHRARESSAILVSTCETARAFEALGVKVQIIPTIGIEKEVISDRCIPEPQGPLKLLFVGSIIALKGVELAIYALEQSRTDATLAFIGDGKFLEAAQALVRKHKLTDRVTFLGRKSRSEVLKLYAEHHVFVFPSLHDSGAFAVIEAMSQGLPVICLDCGGPALSVQENCGIRVPLGKRKTVIAGLASAIEFYDRNRAKVAQHGATGRDSVLQNYEWNRKGEQMHEIYEQVIEQTRDLGESLCQQTLRKGLLARQLVSISGITAMLLVFACIVGLQLWTIGKLKHQAEAIATDTLPGLAYAGAANETRNQSFISILMYVMEEDSRQQDYYLKDAEALAAKTSRFLSLYQASIKEKEDQQTFKKVTTSRTSFLTLRKELQQLVQQGKRKEVLTLLETKLAPAFDAYDDEGWRLMEYNMRRGRERSEKIMSMHRITEIMLSIEGIVIFVLGFGLGFIKK